MDIRVKSVARHRNGVSGEGFHVVLFQENDENPGRNFVGVVFGQKKQVAILDVNMAAAGNVRYAENSWRGDNFEDDLRAAIRDSVYAPGYEEMRADGWTPEEAQKYSRRVTMEEYLAGLEREK